MKTKDAVTPDVKYKDRLFCILFSEKKRVLELYNALNETNHEDSDELEITAWEDVLYMNMKNDVSMMIDGRLNLYEHQSSWNPNMPLRGLFYFADLYKRLAKDCHLYSSKLIRIPTPIYIVFYNGPKDIGERMELKLSDAFLHGNEQSGMELKTRMLNINYGHNKELMERCKTLKDYAIFAGKVKEYSKIKELWDAIEQAMDDCIQGMC